MSDRGIEEIIQDNMEAGLGRQTDDRLLEGGVDA